MAVIMMMIISVFREGNTLRIFKNNQLYLISNVALRSRKTTTTSGQL
jgi:hypothetical protein